MNEKNIALWMLYENTFRKACLDVTLCMMSNPVIKQTDAMPKYLVMTNVVVTMWIIGFKRVHFTIGM